MTREIRALKEQYEAELMEQENVSSVGIGLDGEGNEVVVIGVKDQSQALSIPQDLSHQTVVEEVGDIQPEVLGALVAPQADRKSRHRPVPGGVSTGHVDITAGTSSFILEDGGGNRYTASNNHVYAAINDAQPGDPIIQPGSADGGSQQDDLSAELADYVPIENGVTVDLAWAIPKVEHETELLDVGVPKGETRRAEVGETVVKSGRTTGVKEAQVQQVEATVDVNYGDAGVIRLTDQVLTGDMSEPGDSGSAVLGKSDDAPVGLLFAGSSTVTVVNQATQVEKTSGLSIVTGEGGGDAPTAEVNIELTPTGPSEGNLRVAVTDAESGAAVEGANVSASGADSVSGTTDSDGVAAFDAVPVGSYSISVTAEGYESGSATVTESDFQ